MAANPARADIELGSGGGPAASDKNDAAELRNTSSSTIDDKTDDVVGIDDGGGGANGGTAAAAVSAAEVETPFVVQPATYLEIVKYFGILGWTAFGGPAAHVAMFQKVGECAAVCRQPSTVLQIPPPSSLTSPLLPPCPSQMFVEKLRWCTFVVFTELLMLGQCMPGGAFWRGGPACWDLWIALHHDHCGAEMSPPCTHALIILLQVPPPLRWVSAQPHGAWCCC